MDNRKPFHESIVDIMNQDVCPSHATIALLCALIQTTIIPKNHDVIRDALSCYRSRGGAQIDLYYIETMTSLTDQKRRVEEEAQKKRL